MLIGVRALFGAWPDHTLIRGTAKRPSGKCVKPRAREGAGFTAWSPDENSRFSNETRSRSYAKLYS